MNTPHSHCLRRLLQLGVLLAGLVSVLAWGQPSGTGTSTAEAKKARPYRITNADKLRIVIFHEDDLSCIARVDTKGMVNLNLVQEVPVAGLTISEAQKAIENAYREGRFLRNPQVTINMEEYAPREVFIDGQVKAQGKYPLPVETSMTVRDLIFKANGFTDTANGSKVKVTRIGPDGKPIVFIIDVQSLILGKSNKAKVEDNSLELEPGDMVHVPERII